MSPFRVTLCVRRKFIASELVTWPDRTTTALARLPFIQAADEYTSARKLELATASQAKEKQLLVQLRAYFKQGLLRAITVKRITDYRTWRAEQEVGPARLNAELGILRRILKRAKLWARVADDIKPLKEPSTIGRALTEEDKRGCSERLE